MTKIFLSYRRDDTSGHVGRLTDRLWARFGRDSVFRDLDSIAPGRDFTMTINEAISACDAVVAVIGRNWAGAFGADGQRRIDDPDDFVRVELATALARKMQIIPVLVDRAGMPSPESLPAPLVALARRNALEISETRWDYDVQRLIDVLDPASPETLSGSIPVVARAGSGPSTRPGVVVGATADPDRRKRRLLAGAVAGGLVLMAIVVLALSTMGGDDPSVTAGGTTIPVTTTSTTPQSSTTLVVVTTRPSGGGIGGGGGSPTPTSPSPTSPAPTSPSPTSPNPTTPQPTAPAPTVAQSVLTADAVAGNWSGTVSDGSGGSFLLTVSVRTGCQLNQTCGAVYVSNNNCTGDFIFHSLSAGTYEFRVANFTPSSGPSCMPGAGEYLTPQSGGSLNYTTNYGPQGTLNRA